MEDSQRDDTQDWLLPEDSRPPLLSELVERIDEAMAMARSSESAAMSVGAAALDAAEQARRAAELAERAADRASAALHLGLKRKAESNLAGWPEDRQRRFSQRADRIVARLRELQSH
ncbi:MAG: hypothetical protein WD827_05500 [Solirubrobacterales bacterium]